MKDLTRILHAATTQRGNPWCLATLVKAEGSSYRQPGARLLVPPEGRSTIGYLTAGCLEEEIAQHGSDVISHGVPRLMDFDTRKLYGCDGRISIYLEKIPPAAEEGNFLTEMALCIARRELCTVAVPYAAAGPSCLLPDKTPVTAAEGHFVQTLPPPRRLIIFGSGPEVAPLHRFANGLGWLVQSHPHPDELPADFRPDGATAAVIMTHKMGRDLAALHRLMPWGLPYIGLLGARKRQQEILSWFVEIHGSSLPTEGLSNLYAPAGLDIGSESPEEIALSILAEAAAVLAGRKGGFLRDKSGSIHQREASL